MSKFHWKKDSICFPGKKDEFSWENQPWKCVKNTGGNTIFFYFSTPFLYACVFGMGLFFSARWGWVGGYKGLSFPVKESPCYTNSLSLFVLLNSEKNEQRNAAAVIGPFGLSLRSPSGSAELAPLKHSSPFSLRLVSLAASPPDKGGIGDCCFCLYSNPLALRALPLSHLRWAEGEDWKYHINSFYSFGALWGFTSSPVFCTAKYRGGVRRTEGLKTPSH